LFKGNTMSIQTWQLYGSRNNNNEPPPSVPSSEGKLYKITEQLYDKGKPTTTNEYYATIVDNYQKYVLEDAGYKIEEVNDPEKKATHSLVDAYQNDENDNIVNFNQINGGGRRPSKPSQKRPTARRRRSSKSRKARKARTTRRR
jgi:hypothetical protein